MKRSFSLMHMEDASHFPLFIARGKLDMVEAWVLLWVILLN